MVLPLQCPASAKPEDSPDRGRVIPLRKQDSLEAAAAQRNAAYARLLSEADIVAAGAVLFSSALSHVAGRTRHVLAEMDKVGMKRPAEMETAARKAEEKEKAVARRTVARDFLEL